MTKELVASHIALEHVLKMMGASDASRIGVGVGVAGVKNVKRVERKKQKKTMSRTL